MRLGALRHAARKAHRVDGDHHDAGDVNHRGDDRTEKPGSRGGLGSAREDEREEQILKALVRGQSNKMIARMCCVTEATVKVHMKSILRKIRVANRTQAAIWALKNAGFGEQTDRRA